jgi:cell shape-determining protein MreD
VQLIVNNTTILYIDCLTILLVIFLLEGLFSIKIILVISLLADLFGHWYLGTHLLAIILISFPIKNLVNFYKLSNTLQKIVLNGIFTFITYIIIELIDILLHNSSINWVNLLIEVIVLNPILLLISNILINKLPFDFILTE